MANPRKVDVSEDRPAEEQEAVRNVDPKALKGPTQKQAEAASLGDNEYRREQLIENSSVLLGVPRFVAEATLGDEDAYSLSKAKSLVEKFQNHEVTV